MGQSRRAQPKRLALKLRQIRLQLELTQQQIADHLRDTDSPPQAGHISEYERGIREPSLLVLLAYARLAKVSTDVLIDDKLDLPD